MTYWDIISNRFSFFALMTVFIGLVQYTFYDPFLATYLEDEFGITPAYSGIFFLTVAAFYAIACAHVETIERKIGSKATMQYGSFAIIIASLIMGPTQMLP